MSTELTTRSATDLILDPGVMGQLYKVAEIMASSHITVPKHLQQSPGDCMAICMQSAQWGMNPFAVAQKTHLVNGNLGYEAQLVNAVISSSKAIRGRFHYDFDQWEGENGLIRVGAVLAGEEDITWGEWLDTSKVKVKNSPLWKTAPKQQAAYLAVKMWSRLFTPEVVMGVYSKEELEDAPTTKQERDITPQPEQPKPTTAESLFANMPTQQNAKSAEIEINENQPEQTHEVVSSKPEPTTPKTETVEPAADEERNAKISAYVDAQIKAYGAAAGDEGKQFGIWEATKNKLRNEQQWFESFCAAVAD